MNRTQRAFSLVELLVVIGIIAVLIAILMVALAAVKGAGARVQSMNHLRSIGQWMTQYSQENKSFIVPSQFNYNGAPYAGKVKSEPSNRIDLNMGTWTDIIWTLYVGTSFPQAVSSLQHDYKFDSPDNSLYDIVPDYNKNPVRSTVIAERGAVRGLPGYFAANNFFNANPNDPNNPAGWWTTAQIKQPADSLYAIDSVAGESIDPKASNRGNSSSPRYWGRYLEESILPQVDYRYEGDALVLLLDGNVRTIGEIMIEPSDTRTDLEFMEDVRKVRVQNLDKRQQ